VFVSNFDVDLELSRILKPFINTPIYYYTSSLCYVYIFIMCVYKRQLSTSSLNFPNLLWLCLLFFLSELNGFSISLLLLVISLPMLSFSHCCFSNWLVF
jgi:hypothetical protein